MTTETEELTLEEKRQNLLELKTKRRDKIQQFHNFHNKRNELRKIRDVKNKESKELFILARTEKEKRDKINEEVQFRKQMRDILREDADVIGKRLLELGSQMKTVGAPRNRRVGERMRRLERQLETTPFLTKEMEKQTLLQLEELSEEFEKMEQFKELRNEFRDMKQKLRYMQTEIRTYHTSVTTLAHESQVHQEKMLESNKEARKIKETADEIHAEIIVLNATVTDLRKELDGLTQAVKKIGSEFSNEFQAQRKARKIEAKKAIQRKIDDKVEEILERYKDGAKLNLDEFKILMERGLI